MVITSVNIPGPIPATSTVVDALLIRNNWPEKVLVTLAVSAFAVSVIRASVKGVPPGDPDPGAVVMPLELETVPATFSGLAKPLGVARVARHLAGLCPPVSNRQLEQSAE